MVKAGTFIKARFYLFLAIVFNVGHIYLGTSVMAQDYAPVKAMTWNIRLDTPVDGPDQWKYRKSGLCSMVMEERPDVLGVQEAFHSQLTDMKCRLKGYRYTGTGRDDGKKGGEYSAIFYNRKVLKILRSGTFWLSETPETAGSKGWDAALPRIASWAEFRHIKTGIIFLVINTHFDHIGETARVESAALLTRRAAELGNGLPVILTGDFNVNPGHRAYRIIIWPENEIVLTDTRERSEADKEGPEFTYVSFDRSREDGELIDFIFTSTDVQVLSNTITDFRQTGIYLSDHLPVVARLLVPQKAKNTPGR